MFSPISFEVQGNTRIFCSIPALNQLFCCSTLDMSYTHTTVARVVSSPSLFDLVELYRGSIFVCISLIV